MAAVKEETKFVTWVFARRTLERSFLGISKILNRNQFQLTTADSSFTNSTAVTKQMGFMVPFFCFMVKIRDAFRK